jgi:predicted metal-dependent hydrolase
MPLPRGAVDQMAHRVEPDDVVSTVAEGFAAAVALFDAQRFFEAHEFLEWIWKHDDVDPCDRDFWKGVTQVAVACVHTQRGNATGALTLLERAVGYLAGSPEQHLGVDRAALSHAALRLAAAVRADGAHPDHDFPRFPRLPVQPDG